MDPKILAMFRLVLGLSDKLLPDSIKPEELGKLIEVHKGKQEGNPEDIKNLQKIISDKDIKLKDALTKIEKKKQSEDKNKTEAEKKIDSLTSTVEKMTGVITTLRDNQRYKDLSEKYPDILPELLQGKNDEDVEKIVEKQRDMNKKLYGDSKEFDVQGYKDIDEVAGAIDSEKKNMENNGVESAIKVLELGREKSAFN